MRNRDLRDARDDHGVRDRHHTNHLFRTFEVHNMIPYSFDRCHDYDGSCGATIDFLLMERFLTIFLDFGFSFRNANFLLARPYYWGRFCNVV